MVLSKSKTLDASNSPRPASCLCFSQIGGNSLLAMMGLLKSLQLSVAGPLNWITAMDGPSLPSSVLPYPGRRLRPCVFSVPGPVSLIIECSLVTLRPDAGHI